jgi:hypothetical protein
MSALCQQRTSQLLFDHVVGETKDRVRDHQTDFLCGTEVDDQVELRGLFYGEIGGLCAFENLVHEVCGAPERTARLHRSHRLSPKVVARPIQTFDRSKIKFLAASNKTLHSRRFNNAIGFSWRKSMWHRELSAAPFNRDLELAIIDAGGEHAMLYACRRVVGGWIKAATERRLKFRPTHWRIWAKDA